MAKKLWVILMSLCCCAFASAQHKGHHPPKPNAPPSSDTAKARTSSPAADTLPTGHDHTAPTHSLHTMSHQFSRHLPMTRNGSGTSWEPDNSPMYMLMHMGDKWNLMLHYSLFLRYTYVNFNNPGKRGRADGFIAPNWVMGMASRKVGARGLLSLRAMLSADPLTVGGGGYPLLFQTGESWQGRPLVDRQHPHDLFSELSIGYSHALDTNTDVFGYFGYPGEPALGPPAFMHRPSALVIPTAPLGHHWQDGTHITFGVATLGFRWKNLKLDGSLFTGREPDENRYNFERPRFDSYSFRLAWNPDPALALSASFADIHSPEALFPEENVQRFNFSALHNLWLDDRRVLSSAFVWGTNLLREGGDLHPSHSALLEGSLQSLWWTYFTRIEAVQKSDHELFLENHASHAPNLVTAASLGLSRYLLKTPFAWLDLGVMGTYHAINTHLQTDYGRQPLSGEVFLRVTPPRMGNGELRMKD